MTTPASRANAFAQRDLYGGAITTEIPADWVDVSDIRQVPDHQECFQGRDNSVLCFEILERQDIPDGEAAKYFFHDLAEANGSDLNQFETLTIPGVRMENATLCGGIGYQRVTIGRDYDVGGNRRQDEEVHSIRVEVCVFRLANVSTDVLMTLSKPITNPNEPSGASAFQRAVSTLTIRDWGLFG